MNNSKAKYTIGIIIIVLILVGIYWVFMKDSRDTKSASTTTTDNTVMTDQNLQPSDPSMTTDNSATNTNTTPPSGTNTGAAKLSYTEALKKYAASRIQLDGNCQAVPKTTTYKAGTTIMFDNRASVSRKIMYNLKTYTIAGYDYLLLPATAAKYPAITFVDCGDKQNVATITIQK